MNTVTVSGVAVVRCESKKHSKKLPPPVAKKRSSLFIFGTDCKFVVVVCMCVSWDIQKFHELNCKL